VKKALVILVLLALVLPVTAEAFAIRTSDRHQESSRTLIGVVSDKNDKPLPNAVVYLKNTKTLTVRTFIADDQASYRFHELSPNVDYEVWAEFNGKKSDVRTLSSFDTRTNARINLKINMQ
jgi:hypothetical protein